MNFLQRLAFQEEKLDSFISMLLKSHPSPDMLPFSLCNKKKTCNLAHEQTLFSSDTISSIRHLEVGRAKDLTAPPHMKFVVHSLYQQADLVLRNVFSSLVIFVKSTITLP
jgi:hypothetical protein